MKLILSGLLACLISVNVYCQFGTNFSFERIGIKQGLSQSTVYSIIKDHEGFMWFATQNGLNRYDGYKFTVYKHDPLDSNSLPPDILRRLCEDKDGDLWIGSDNEGLLKFDKSTGKCKKWKNDKNNIHSLSCNIVSYILQDHIGRIWVGTYGGGINLFDRKTQSFQVWKHETSNPNSLNNNYVLSISEDPSGMIWVGTSGGGFSRFNPTLGSFEHYESPDVESITPIVPDKNNMLWLGTNHGLHLFDSRKGKIVRSFYNVPGDSLSLCNNKVSHITFDNNGWMWIGTPGGVNILEAKTGRMIAVRNNPYDPNSLCSNIIGCIYYDPEGIVWVAGEDCGLNKLVKSHMNFNVLRHEPDNKNSLVNNTVISILKSRQNKLWLGTYGDGLNEYDVLKGKFELQRNIPGNPNSLSNDLVTCILEDKKDNIWIGTLEGLNKYDPRGKRFTVWKNDPMNVRSLSGNKISWLCQNGDILWVSTIEKGLNALDLKTETFKEVEFEKEPNNKYIIFIFIDHNGYLWVANYDGVSRYKINNKGLKLILSLAQASNPIINCRVNCIHEDKQGRIWLGSAGEGLYLFDPAKGMFYAYTDKDGLPDNVLNGILEDKMGRLWLSTNKGLSRCTIVKNNSRDKRRPPTIVFKNYDDGDGLQSNEFNQDAFFGAADGTMYFGGINGLNFFRPELIKDNAFSPRVYITDFQLFNKSIIPGDVNGILKKPIYKTDSILLSYKQNVFTFEFAALSFSNPGKNQYAYNMEGFDRDWIYTDAKKRMVTYTNLDPGIYRFRVKASNNDGLWNEKGTSIVLIIKPPFWQTWWFRSIIIFLFLAIIVYAVRALSLRKYKRKLAELERYKEIEAIRSRISRDMHDSIGAGLTKISLLSQNARRHLPQNESSGILDKLTDVSVEIAHNLGEIVWAVNPANDSLNGMLAYIRQYIVEFFEGSDVKLNITFPEDIIDRNVNPELRRNLFLIIKEAINNILKHSNATTVHVGFEINGDTYQIIMDDNGIGIDENNTSAFANGIKNMKQRAESINGILIIESSKENGTKITIKGRIN